MSQYIISSFIVALFMFNIVQAQIYPIGSVNTTWNDPARNRDVNCWIRYPAVSQGTNVDVANGSFPVIIFGHGFVMDQNVYSSLWNALVPHGYIIVLPTTESSFSPSHSNFGADIAFLAAKMQSENANAASPFYQRVSDKSAVMGHSMGGGSAFLAAANNTSITTIATLAAAETNPSAIAAAANITVPALVISGEADCVTPPADNQIPMYNALASACKTFISIKQGSHCYFAEYSFNCTFGESTCNPVPALPRDAQLDVTNDMLLLWFNHWLKGSCQAWEDLQDSLAVSQRITSQQSCTEPVPVVGMNGNDLEVTPSGNGYQWYFEGNELQGETAQLHTPQNEGFYSAGVYYLTYCPVMSAPYQYTMTGMENAAAGESFLFPNPSGNEIRLNGINETGELRIIDTKGKTVFIAGSFSPSVTINISSLSSGLYFVNFTTRNSVQQFKFVKL